MELRNIHAYGVICSVYHCDKGEGLPWHDHKRNGLDHGHVVIAGSTQLDIEDEPSRVVTPTDCNVELPVGKKHQIMSLEDGTIFINVAPGVK